MKMQVSEEILDIVLKVLKGATATSEDALFLAQEVLMLSGRWAVNCHQCDSLFIARKSQRYCSDQCRWDAHNVIKIAEYHVNKTK